MKTYQVSINGIVKGYIQANSAHIAMLEGATRWNNGYTVGVRVTDTPERWPL